MIIFYLAHRGGIRRWRNDVMIGNYVGWLVNAPVPRSIERSRALRSCLKKELFPLLEERGFKPLEHTSLYYEFGRVQEGRLHVFEIQWDKYHRPRFVVNFGTADIELGENGEAGVRNPFMDLWLPLKKASAGGLPEHNRLRHGRSQWFRYGMLAGLFTSDGDRRTVSRCVAMLPLVESWFGGDPESRSVVDRMNGR